MDIFKLDDALISRYSKFARSFSEILAPEIRDQVEEIYKDNRFWPDPLITINPHYKSGKTVGELAEGDDIPTENPGKGIEPKLPEKEVKKERTLEDELLNELDDEQELAISTKLGEFERQTTQLARAHDISRTTEPGIGMGV